MIRRAKRLILPQQLICVAGREMTAVYEHQLGNRTHLPDECRPQKQPAGKNDAARTAIPLQWIICLLWLRTDFFWRLTVTRNVQDAPVACQEHVCHLGGIRAELVRVFRADQCAYRLLT